MILIKAVRWAVFPFNSKLITNGHHRDLNHRLTAEMLRLFKGVSKILEAHMQLDEATLNASIQLKDELNDRAGSKDVVV